jgi:hypothetical protein
MVDKRFTKCRNGTILPKQDMWDTASPEKRGHVLYRFRAGAPASHMARGAMADPKPQASRAGGFIIAVTVIAGAIIGIRYGQPSIGLLIGGAVGAAVSIALFIWDRRR